MNTDACMATLVARSVAGFGEEASRKKIMAMAA